MSKSSLREIFIETVYKSSPSRGVLLNPFLDFLMIGGLSLIFFPAFLLLVPKNQDISSLAWTMFYLSFVINYPHFLISYQFLYIDNLKQITKDWRLCLAGIIVPLVLFTYIMYCVSLQSGTFFGYMANAMFFFVGHHYVKQIIGCVVVTSALKGVYFTKQERLFLSINMLWMWMISFFGGNIGKYTSELHGMKYNSFNFPEFSVSVCYGFILVSLAILALQIVHKFIQTGKWIPLNSFVAFASIYAWYIPVVYHPSYFYMIPFFHSLQYLLFAFTYVKNRFHSKIPHSDPINDRKRLVWGIGIYVLGSLVLGAAFFEFIPKYLDQSVAYNKSAFGPELFMFIFIIFINIHHYFIDFAIWRRGNENVRRYLFA